MNEFKIFLISVKWPGTRSIYSLYHSETAFIFLPQDYFIKKQGLCHDLYAYTFF